MADMGGKSYKDTSPLGSEVDLTGEREIEAARAFKAEAESETASGFGDEQGRWSELSESAAAREASRLAARARETAADAYDEARDRASSLYDGAREQLGAARQRIDKDVGTAVEGARSQLSELASRRPLQLAFGAALAGFLLGRFG